MYTNRKYYFCSFIKFCEGGFVCIFDTLIKRNVREATDVFSLLENAYINQFGHSEPIKKWRIAAEKEANKRSSYNDVNLDEIYQAMEALPEEERGWLKEKK